MASHRPRICKSKPTFKVGITLTEMQFCMISAALLEFRSRSLHSTPFGIKALSDEGRSVCDGLLDMLTSTMKMFPDYGKEK